MNSERNPITDLILAERQRQTAKWGNPHRTFDIWLLILQEEMGEVAKALLEDAPLDEVINEAVQVTAVAVQMGERISELVGWSNTSEEVIRVALGGYMYSAGDPVHSFAMISQEVGMIAALVKERLNFGAASSLSNYTRKIIFYGFELIYRLQQKGGQSA